MPEASPHLHQLLNRWISRSVTLRKEMLFQHDLLSSYAMTLDAARLSYREARLRDFQAFKEQTASTESRWKERIHRIEEWQKELAYHQTHRSQLSSAAETVQWMRRVELSAEPFIDSLTRRAQSLHEQQTGFHTDLIQWLSVLEEQHRLAQELKQKEQQTARRILVSRTRRQQELNFIEENRRIYENLALRLQKLRRSLNHALGRLQKAYVMLEHRTAHKAIPLETHKRDLTAALDPLRTLFYQRRDQILGDALLFESAKRLFRSIQDYGNSLQCTEEVYREKPSGWRTRLGL